MDGTRQPERHLEVNGRLVSMVAYPREDHGWDVFLCEPRGSVPELDSARVDDERIYVKRIARPDELPPLVDEVEAWLGPDYELTRFYTERGGRRLIQKLHDGLRRLGAHRMAVRRGDAEYWTLHIRRKDADLARRLIRQGLDNV